MFRGKFNGFLSVLLILAIIAIIGLLGYFGWSVYNKYYLNASASNAAQEFIQDVTAPSANDSNVTGDGNLGEVEGSNSMYNGNGSGNNKTYNGYKVLGVISIPKILNKTEYPILDRATIQAIKVAIGFLSGAGVNEVRKLSASRT